MNPRTYCLQTLGFTLIGLAMVASLNWLIDPYGQYATGCLPAIVQASRTEKVNLLEKQANAPEGMVLGSSRVLKIEPSYLRQKTGFEFFNAGVNHGRPTDFLAMIRWYEKRWQSYPKIVVIGIDSVALGEFVPLDARIVTEHRLASVVPETVRWKDSLSLYTELISLKQARSSLQSLARAFRSKTPSEPIEFFEPDGKIVYRQRESELAEGRYDFQQALAFNQREFEQLYRSFTAISAVEVKRLVETIQLLRQNKTEVYLFVTPFHPDMISALEKQTHFETRETEVRTLLTLLSARYGVRTADWRSVSEFDGEPSRFVDGIHPLEENTRRMMDCLFESQGVTQYAIQ